MLDPVILSRIQFAFHISFHYIFPPMTIGVSLYLVILEALYLITKNKIYETLTRFWVKIFGLIFALGVATGIVNVFGFGTNWAEFSHFVGDVFGSLLGAEGVFAFTMESGFLGVLLFGWERVSSKMHFLATFMVALGAHFSATWIVFANSWMQTPAGYQVVGEGLSRHCELTSFWQAVFNPSALTRLGHVLLGCWLTGTFLILSVAAYYLLKKRHIEYARKLVKLGLIIGGITILLQLWSADSSGRAAAKFQPAKLAGLEGVWKTQDNSPFYVVGWSDAKKRETYGIKIPGLLSFLVYHKFKQPVKGLDQIPEEDWPVTTPIFQTYRWMIYMWGWMLMVMLWAWYAYKKNTLEKSPLLLRIMVFSILAPITANLAGWFSAEMGRQPWVVYGIMRTEEGISRSIHGSQVLGSLITYVVMFTLLLFVFLFLLDKKIKEGPEDREHSVDPYRDPFKAREDTQQNSPKGI